MTAEDDARWRLQVEKYGKALATLEKAVVRARTGELDDLARDGLIQRFEFTFELGWKTIADFFAVQGQPLRFVSARNVIRAAYEAKLVKDGDGWIAALNDRNESSHVYDEDRSIEIASAVSSRYVLLLADLHERLVEEAAR